MYEDTHSTYWDIIMKSEAYKNGYVRGKSLRTAMHHRLTGQDMKDYLEGFRVGQAEALTRRGMVKDRRFG